MRTPSDLRPHQRLMIKFMLSKVFCAIWCVMGGGKTASALTAASVLINNLFAVRVLVIAPLRVANTVWAQEAQLWTHLRHLEFSICTGTEEQRRLGVNADADIYVINRENVNWLVDYFGPANWPFDMVIIDEASSFKNHAANRWKALRKIRPQVRHFIELTGTPATEGYIGLWAQISLMDQGTRLLRSITAFRRRWFEKNYMGTRYELREGAKQEIEKRIQDIVLVVENYEGMPEVSKNSVVIPFPSKLRNQYDEFKRECLLELQEADIEAQTAGVLTNKLLQFCQGAVYDEEKNWHHIHDLKIDELKELVEQAQGQPMLVAYNFKSDLERLKKAFPHARELDKKGAVIPEWNTGKVPMLLIHPQSGGHGLNLQVGGRIVVWFGLTWSLEYYEQLNARLARQGQTDTVIIHHLLVKDSMDEIVLAALQSKRGLQDSLIKALRNMRAELQRAA